MPHFRDISLKNKLRLIIFLTSSIVVFFVSSAFVTSEVIIFRSSMVAELLTLADLMGMNSTAGILFEDQNTTTENLASLKAKPHITLAHVFSNKGEIFASYYTNEILPQDNLVLNDYYYSNPAVQGNKQIEDKHFFKEDYVEVFKKIALDGELLGTIYIRSDLKELDERIYWTILIIAVVSLTSLLFGFLLTYKLQQLITKSLYSLLATMAKVSQQKDYSIREEVLSNDELGALVNGFNSMLIQVERRDQELAYASQKIVHLNKRLEAENMRMGTELDVTRQLQQMVLPKPEELQQIEGLEIAGFMEPADEVGGDYYDVLQYNGHVKIGIGDVTGHGLESGMLMLMVQMAVRTLLVSEVSDPEDFLNILNRAVFDNIQRVQVEKNLTLSLLDYKAGTLWLTGQHEDVLLVRKGGEIELIDTFDFGFMVGLKPDISSLVSHLEIKLELGDGIVLFTDGITEAQNLAEEQYGIERLCEVTSNNWSLSASEIQQAVVADVRQYIGEQKVFDDITILVLKQIL